MYNLHTFLNVCTKGLKITYFCRYKNNAVFFSHWSEAETKYDMYIFLNKSLIV